MKDGIFQMNDFLFIKPPNADWNTGRLAKNSISLQGDS